MTDSNELFDQTLPDESVFADKSARPAGRARRDRRIAREAHQEQQARLLNDINEGYLSTTVSIFGPPGTGKPHTTQRICKAFAALHEGIVGVDDTLTESYSIDSATAEPLDARHDCYSETRSPPL